MCELAENNSMLISHLKFDYHLKIWDRYRCQPHPQWGETPCAFIKTKDNYDTNVKQEEIVSFYRHKLPRYMAPKAGVFMTDLPKTSIGKI